MDKAFKRLASIRKFMALSDIRTLPDFGRKIVSDWIVRWNDPVPSNIEIQEFDYPVKGLLITPTEKKPSTLLIYIHGGGLVYYDTKVFRCFLAKIATCTHIEVIALDYPKAPETESKVIISELHSAIKKYYIELEI